MRSLPLDALHILTALADHDRHGYAIMQDVQARTRGAVRLSPSTLYTLIRRLLTDGLIAETASRPDPAHDDERRRYYQITKAGRRAAADEAARLERVVAGVRAAGLLRRGQS